MAQNVGAIVGIVASVSVVVGIAGAVLAFFFSKKHLKKTLIDKNVNQPLRIVDRNFITHDTMRLKLGLPTPDHILGLPVGNHVYLSARINGELVTRPYTPVSLDSQKGFVDFVIKVYKANTNPRFPNGGKMSQYLSNLPIEGFVDVRGPAGNLEYKGSGLFHIKPDARSDPVAVKTSHVSMICGGSGITPMYQLLSYILNSPKDETKISMVFANMAENDIILRDELEALRDKYPLYFKLWYTLTEAPESWSYGKGFVNDQMLQEHIYPPGNDNLVLVCGPPPMIELACLPNLAKLKYPKDRIFVF